MGQLGLFAFKNVTKHNMGRNGLVVRFRENVSNRHMAEIMESIHFWMLFRKLLAEAGDNPITAEQGAAFLEGLRGKRPTT